jgi:hypothetical protein
MKISRVSRFTGKTHEMELPITQRQIYRFNNGEMVQDVFPDLTPGQREFILTGVTQEEWDLFMKEEE